MYRFVICLAVLGTVACGPDNKGGGGAPVCRKLAARFLEDTTALGGASDQVNVCSFDDVALAVTCTASTGSGEVTTTYHYASAEDFVKEKSLGRVGVGKWTSLTSSVGTTQENTYNAQGWIETSVTRTDSGDVVQDQGFFAWDLFGRPTAGTRTVPLCTDMTVTWSYDDEGRQYTMSSVGGTSLSTVPGAGCATPEATTWHFDENLLQTSLDFSKNDGAQTGTVTRSIEETVEVCD